MLQDTEAAVSDPRRVPGEPGIWVMVAGDLLVFSLFFATFASYRRGTPEVYAASQAMLDRGIGLANTLLLLTGSLFVAQAVHRARNAGTRAAAPYMGLAALSGFAFLADKIVEWTQLISAGVSIYTGDFFMFFFMFTGIHAFHVLIATAVVVYLYRGMKRSPAEALYMPLIEAGGVFWHLIDVLWIVLFAVFYLAR